MINWLLRKKIDKLNINLDLNRTQKKSRNIISLSGALVWGIASAILEVYKRYSENFLLNLYVGLIKFFLEAIITFFLLFVTITIYQKICFVYSLK